MINEGELSDVRGQQITIMFPNNLYFSIEHILDGDYEFSFSFFYEDNEPESDESLLSIFKIEDAQTDGKSQILSRHIQITQIISILEKLFDR